jgi:hypothetical protein
MVTVRQLPVRPASGAGHMHHLDRQLRPRFEQRSFANAELARTLGAEHDRHRAATEQLDEHGSVGSVQFWAVGHGISKRGWENWKSFQIS